MKCIDMIIRNCFNALIRLFARFVGISTSNFLNLFSIQISLSFAAPNNNSPSLSRNEYRIPTATGNESSSTTARNGNLVQRQLPLLPQESENRQGNLNFPPREPPPSYWATYRNQRNQLENQRIQRPRRPAPAPPTRSQINQITIRSRVEQYRNQINVSDSDTDDDRERRSRILPPRRIPNGPKNEVLLGEFLNSHSRILIKP